MKRIGLLTAVLLCLGASGSEAQQRVCGNQVCISGAPAVYAPCWAACLQWLSCEYNKFHTQMAFASYACWKNQLKDALDPNCPGSLECNVPACNCWHVDKPCLNCKTCQPGVQSVMSMAGFSLSPNSIDPVLSEVAVYNILCEPVHWHILTFHYGGNNPTSGHAMVINGYYSDNTLEYMDPYSGLILRASYSSYLSLWGGWKESITICDWSPSTDFLNLVGIGDIASFSIDPMGCSTQLDFSIVSTADPDEESAVYVADNLLGPARLIEPLVGAVLLEPGTNSWVDQWRYCGNKSDYYYYMDHDRPALSPSAERYPSFEQRAIIQTIMGAI